MTMHISIPNDNADDVLKEEFSSIHNVAREIVHA